MHPYPQSLQFAHSSISPASCLLFPYLSTTAWRFPRCLTWLSSVALDRVTAMSRSCVRGKVWKIVHVIGPPPPLAHTSSPTLCTRANHQTFYPNISATIRPEELRFNFGGKQSYLTYPKLPEIQTDVQTDRDRRIGFTLFSTQWCLTLMLWLLELK